MHWGMEFEFRSWMKIIYFPFPILHNPVASLAWSALQSFTRKTDNLLIMFQRLHWLSVFKNSIKPHHWHAPEDVGDASKHADYPSMVRNNGITYNPPRPSWETHTMSTVNDQWASTSFWFPPNENGRTPKMCTHGGFSPPTESVAGDGHVPFISWQFREMNQTTWPPRDPRGEQGNKCLVLKTWTFPRALAHRDNVMAEIPFQLFQTGKETRRFPDLTSPQILLVLPFLLSRHGENGMSCIEPSAEHFPSGVSLLKGRVM